MRKTKQWAELGMVLALVVTGAGCGLDVVEISVTQQAQFRGLALEFPGIAQFASNLVQALNNQKIDPSKIDSLRLQAADIQMLSQGGTTEDLAFLHNLTFTAQATNQPDARLAWKDFFPAGTRKSRLDIQNNFELKPYLSGLMVQATGSLNPPPADLVDVEIRFRLRVDVKVF